MSKHEIHSERRISKHEMQPETDDSAPKKSRRSEANQKRAERKAGKKHADLIQAVKENVETSKDISNLIGGSALELLAKHDGSRLLQRALASSCLSSKGKEALIGQLKGHWVDLAKGQYSVHFVAKLLKSLPKCVAQVIEEFLQCRSLWPLVGNKILDLLFAEHMNVAKRASVLSALAKELGEVKKGKGKGEVKKDLETTSPITQALDRGAATSVVLHAFLLQHPEHRDTESGPIPLESLIHTQPGAKLAASIIASTDAKGKKLLIKSLKPVVEEAIRGEYSHLAVIAAIWAVDDTVLLEKHLLAPLATCSFIGPWEARVALFCLVGPCKKYFPATLCDWLTGGQVPQGKKDWTCKQSELKSYLLECRVLQRCLDEGALLQGENAALRLGIIEHLIKATDSSEMTQVASAVNGLLEQCPSAGFFFKRLIRKVPEIGGLLVQNLDFGKWSLDVRGVYLVLTLLNEEGLVGERARDLLGPLRVAIGESEEKGVKLLAAALGE